MATEQRTTAEQRAALRRRYSPEPGPLLCTRCYGKPEPDGTDDAGWCRWRCPHCGTVAGLTDPGDLHVLAALDALEAAQADVERLRATLTLLADPRNYERTTDALPIRPWDIADQALHQATEGETK